MIERLLSISLGAALGANLRYLITVWAAQRWGASFPYGTVIINVLGSFLIGAFLTWVTTKGVMSEAARLFVVTGFLGGFTTFSTFSFESLSLAGNGNWWYAAAYILSSVGLGLLAAFGGMTVARLL